MVKQKLEIRKPKLGALAALAIFEFLFSIFGLAPARAGAQQPQTPDAPVFSANAKYVQGVGPGYWPTAGSGLTLNIAAGTAYCGHPQTLVTYAGGSLTMTASTTNYVYLNPAASCAPASNTTGFAAGQIPIAKVVTGASSITTVTEARNWFVPQPIGTDASGRAVTKQLNSVRFADQFPGATGPAKLDAAIADIGAGGGTLIVPPGVGAGDATSYPNNVAILDFRQSYDVIGLFTADPDRAPLLLLENRLGELTTKPVTGTVTLTNGSTAVTGTGTQFIAQFQDRYGRSIRLDADSGSPWAQVASVQSDTAMTLAIPYPGTGGTGAASYFITQLGLVVNNVLNSGTPNTGQHGEGVGITSIGWRSGGTRPVFGGNFNVGYYTRDPKAHAVALELDISNISSADAVPGTNVEEGLRMVSAGPKRTAAGIHMLKTLTGGEFVRGLWIDNSYSGQGVFVKGPSDHVYLVPTADNNSPMITGRNAADSATKWVIKNDGSAQFSNLTATPSGSSFGATVQSYFDDSGNAVAILNPSPHRTAALVGANQNNLAVNQIGIWGVAAAENASGTKPFVLGMEGDAYHETSGTVTTLAGVAGYAAMSGTSGTVTKMASFYAYPNAKTAGTVTTNYGLYVESQTAGSSNYSVFTAGTAPAQFGGAVISGMNTVAFSATPTFDAKLGNTQKITLTGNVTSSTLSNATAGEQIHFLICQDATGSRTFAWPSNVKGGMTIGSTASTCSAQNFIFDGTNAYALSTGVSNI